MKTKFYSFALLAFVATFMAFAPAQAQFRIGSDGLKFGINEKESTSKQKERKVRVSSAVDIDENSLNIGFPCISTIPSFEIGWNIISNANYGLYEGTGVGEFFGIHNWKSTQVTVNLLQVSATNSAGTLGVGVGFGFRANDYRFAQNQSIEYSTGIVMPYEIGYSDKARLPKKSKFNVASAHIPVEVFFGDPSKFAFSVGGYFDMVMNSHTKIKYYGGNKIKKYNFPTNFIQAGAVARFTIYGVSVYASYQPTSIFKSSRGPELQQWTIGLAL